MDADMCYMPHMCGVFAAAGSTYALRHIDSHSVVSLAKSGCIICSGQTLVLVRDKPMILAWDKTDVMIYNYTI